jgi:ADP-heptose:LPS heptosyltransferase
MKIDIDHRRWNGNTPPRRVLAMRFQALGDTVITLPYLQSLRHAFPALQLDLLTRKEVAAIPRALELFDDVTAFGGGRNIYRQLLALLAYLPRLRLRGYDLVLDLQNSRLSRLALDFMAPPAWSCFETQAPFAAGERTRQTIADVWDWPVDLDTRLTLRANNTQALLASHGHRVGTELVVLNPAGNLPSRSWPVDSYIEFARLWQARRSPGAHFVLLLLPAMRAKAARIAAALGDACIDLTGAADAVQAFGIVGASQFVLSEDSALMHMAWVQGVPTLALFSSSRKDWSRPLGARTACLDSSDLECGPCGLAVCRFGDNRCLTRHQPEQVFELAQHLLRP